MAQAHGHNHQNSARILHGNVSVDSGNSRETMDFISKYQNAYDGIIPAVLNFDIDCAGCCHQFLHSDRQYELANDLMMVKFGNTTTSCFVAGPQGPAGKHGVVKTNEDPNLGSVGPRTVYKSISYQLYGAPPAGLAVGTNMTARIEAISMPALTEIRHGIDRAKLNGCYFSYANAVALELYRRGSNVPSLKGKCCWPSKTQQENDDWFSKRLAELKL